MNTFRIPFFDACNTLHVLQNLTQRCIRIKKSKVCFLHMEEWKLCFSLLFYFYLLYQYPGTPGYTPGYCTRCAPLDVFNFGQSEGPQVVDLF